MRIVKRSARAKPTVNLVLLDGSVRDLRSGFLDNTHHEVFDVPFDPKGAGMSCELLL